MQKLCNIIKNDSILEKINLSMNNLNYKCLNYISEVICTNKNISSINLSFNNIFNNESLLNFANAIHSSNKIKCIELEECNLIETIEGFD